MFFTFPIQPTPASRPRVSKWGSYYTGPYVAFRENVKPLLAEALAGWTPMDVPMIVTVGIYPERPKSSKLDYPKPDVDNYIKAILDVCNEKVWTDDHLIVNISASKRWSDGAGYFTLQVQEFTDDE